MKRYLVVAVIFMVVLLSTPAYLYTSNNQVKLVSGDRTYWMTLAENAWEYFQPGKGVDINTGLHLASLDYPYFTDWDLGVYIQAIIDAEKLGILSKGGSWGADARIDKILSFLETRELTADGLPFWRYDSRTGRRWGDGSPDLVDAGKLLVALWNLEIYRPDFTERINKVVYERTNYTSMWTAIENMVGSANIYTYYVASGFACFWPKFSFVAEEIIRNIVSAPEVEIYGVKLPAFDVLCDPLFYSIFELQPDARLLDLTKQVYLIHEARYNSTGKYAAFSEGNTGLGNPSYVYEWVVRSDNQTWVVKNLVDTSVHITPIIFFKSAIGFLSIYNTTFAQNMVGYLESRIPQPTNGYVDGIDENGRIVVTTTDKTNGLIMSAARYVLS